MSGSRRDNVGKDLIFLGGLVVVAVALILYLVMDADTDVAGPTAGAAPTSISASPDERAAESGVAPGQPAVFYAGARLLGGGTSVAPPPAAMDEAEAA